MLKNLYHFSVIAHKSQLVPISSMSCKGAQFGVISCTRAYEGPQETFSERSQQEPYCAFWGLSDISLIMRRFWDFLRFLEFFFFFNLRRRATNASSVLFRFSPSRSAGLGGNVQWQLSYLKGAWWCFSGWFLKPWALLKHHLDLYIYIYF